MPFSSRQRAFSRDKKAHEALYDALEAAANLPGGTSLARYNASCMRKSRPTNGLNVGVVYLTKSHVVFYAHFVNVATPELRIALPLRRIVHVRKAWYGRLLPHGVLVRCKGFPDYLLVLCSKDEQKEVLAMITTVMAEAKADESSESEGSMGDSDVEQSETQFPESEPESQPELARVHVRTLRRVKFAQVQQMSPEKLPSEQSDTAESANELQRVMDAAVSRVRQKAENGGQEESVIFFFSAFVLLFTVIGVCVALHLLQLRISVIANRLAVPH